MELLRAVEARYGIRADSLTKRWIGIRGYQDGGLIPEYAAGGKYFRFEAIDQKGQEIKDIVQADDEEDAQATIRLMGYHLTKIAEHRVRKSGSGASTGWFSGWFGGGASKSSSQVGGRHAKYLKGLAKEIADAPDTESKKKILRGWENSVLGKIDKDTRRHFGIDEHLARGGLIYAQHGKLLEGGNYDNIERAGITHQTAENFGILGGMREGTGGRPESSQRDRNAALEILGRKGIKRRIHNLGTQYASPGKLISEMGNGELTDVLQEVLLDQRTGKEVAPGFSNLIIPHWIKSARQYANNAPIEMLEGVKTTHEDMNDPGRVLWYPDNSSVNHLQFNTDHPDFKRNPLGVGSHEPPHIYSNWKAHEYLRGNDGDQQMMPLIPQTKVITDIDKSQHKSILEAIAMLVEDQAVPGTIKPDNLRRLLLGVKNARSSVGRIFTSDSDYVAYNTAPKFAKQAEQRGLLEELIKNHTDYVRALHEGKVENAEEYFEKINNTFNDTDEYKLVNGLYQRIEGKMPRGLFQQGGIVRPKYAKDGHWITDKDGHRIGWGGETPDRFDSIKDIEDFIRVQILMTRNPKRKESYDFTFGRYSSSFTPKRGLSNLAYEVIDTGLGGGQNFLPDDNPFRLNPRKEIERILNSYIAEGEFNIDDGYQHGGLLPRFQTGGKIPGYGGGDRVPILAEQGEYVVNKHSTANNRQLLDAINAGRVQRLQYGGIAGEVRYAARGGSQFDTVADILANPRFRPLPAGSSMRFRKQKKLQEKRETMSLPLYTLRSMPVHVCLQ